MSLSLPDRPNLDQLRKQAKDLLKAHKQGDVSACRVLRHLSRFAASSDQDILKAKVTLAEAQHALAQEYGFKNWAALVRYIRDSARPGQGWRYLERRWVTNVVQSTMRISPYRVPTQGKESEAGCKCRLCDSPGTIHVTDKTEAGMVERHYCVKHAVEEKILGWMSSRSLLYPVKYTIAVPLTQDQVERQETVPITLPDGEVIKMRFPRNSMDGMLVRVGPKPGAAEKYCVCFVLQIIPSAQR
ncbi:MAG: hypothetical protein ABSA67_16200 [Candidatus Brocadiia bacterium]|jgi:hypothetical protein